ncbi:DUF2550 domain-containing protein [Corynebacterium anserum]|uniref:DUF2550 family protein n=1 Tax=Corynebacterium anserum TaxID=2684406 RepID=A0A7G7YP55_9CORY|nr:DUF2550 domain-containing protein [Corynebacterium anserum]QNH96275.1 DUF2550 family protein [Corynebacterium anserum]
MKTLMFILVAIVLIACCAALWRFLNLRSQGYPVVVRSLPNQDGRHWRHGVLLYAGTSARFYQLRSLRPQCDLRFTRLGTEIIGRREISHFERKFLEANLHAVEIAHRGKRYEMALDAQGDTALVAWLESGPSARRDRNSAYNNPRPI